MYEFDIAVGNLVEMWVDCGTHACDSQVRAGLEI